MARSLVFASWVCACWLWSAHLSEIAVWVLSSSGPLIGVGLTDCPLSCYLVNFQSGTLYRRSRIARVHALESSDRCPISSNCHRFVPVINKILRSRVPFPGRNRQAIPVLCRDQMRSRNNRRESFL